MVEIRVATNNGWLALECECPAGRAIFPDEARAMSALKDHLKGCAKEPAGSQYRPCAVELTAA